MKRPPPAPPHPELVRQPRGRFGWLEDSLLREHWLADLGPDAVAVLVLLALAADRYGASFFSRLRMATALAIDLARVDGALDRLRGLRLVALRPWRHRCLDGVWQLLPVPTRSTSRAQRPLSAAEILTQLGLAPRSPAP